MGVSYWVWHSGCGLLDVAKWVWPSECGRPIECGLVNGNGSV